MYTVAKNRHHLVASQALHRGSRWTMGALCNTFVLDSTRSLPPYNTFFCVYCWCFCYPITFQSFDSISCPIVNDLLPTYTHRVQSNNIKYDYTRITYDTYRTVCLSSRSRTWYWIQGPRKKPHPRDVKLLENMLINIRPIYWPLER